MNSFAYLLSPNDITYVCIVGFDPVWGIKLMTRPVLSGTLLTFRKISAVFGFIHSAKNCLLSNSSQIKADPGGKSITSPHFTP